MNNYKFLNKKEIDLPGTPFDLFVTKNSTGAGTRVIPTQFLLPYQPTRFNLLRNVIPEDSETTGIMFS